jgi:hypothetical protein
MARDVNLKRHRHDLAQGIVDHHHVKVLVDVQGDAQDLLQRPERDRHPVRLPPFLTGSDLAAWWGGDTLHKQRWCQPPTKSDIVANYVLARLFYYA